MNKAAALRELEWNKVAAGEWMKKAKARGLVDKDGNLTRSAISAGCWHGTTVEADTEKIGKESTIEVLRLLVELPGGTMKYKVVAVDRHGLPALPKQHGRRKPHVSKQKLTIRSRTINFFRSLFVKHTANLAAASEAEGKPFEGTPQADMPKLGLRASSMAADQVARDARDKRRRKRNQQILSRKINYGLLPGNTNTAHFTK